MIRRNDSMLTRSHGHTRLQGARFRQDRFFFVLNEGWYIETRAGSIGPFSSHETAQHFLDTTYSPDRLH